MVESLNSLFTFRGFHCVLILSLYHFAKDSPTQIKLGSDVMIKVTNPIFKQQFLYCSSLCLRLTTLRFKTKRHGLETVGRVSISSVLKKKTSENSSQFIWFIYLVFITVNCSMFRLGTAFKYPEMSVATSTETFSLRKAAKKHILKTNDQFASTMN